MSNSIYIHFIENTPEADEAMKCYFSNNMDSQYWDPEHECSIGGKDVCTFHYAFMDEREALYVGEISGVRTKLLDEFGEYVPATFDRVEELISTPTEITSELVDQLEAAFALPNKNKSDEVAPNGHLVRPTLEPHVGTGHRAFMITL